MTPIPGPESASEAGHEREERKYSTETDGKSSSSLQHRLTHQCLNLSSPLSIFSGLQNVIPDVYFGHEEQLWRRLPDSYSNVRSYHSPFLLIGEARC